MTEMVTATTEGVKVTVETAYQPDYSNPIQWHFVFTYRVTIENHSNQSVVLRRRQWYIHDARSKPREVEGPGVVGQQPVLEPGEVHEYVSGCNLKSGTGKMLGYYTMERIIDGETFEVKIPEFSLIVPYLHN